MYEATTSEKKTSASSQDLYTTNSRFCSSSSPKVVNVAIATEFFALHLLLCKPVAEEDQRSFSKPEATMCSGAYLNNNIPLVVAMV
jgi:hypothetical protein